MLSNIQETYNFWKVNALFVYFNIKSKAMDNIIWLNGQEKNKFKSQEAYLPICSEIILIYLPTLIYVVL